MSFMDTVGGLLKQYTGTNPSAADAETHFDQVSNAVPSSALGGALADMFRSSDTPPFAQLAAQMFGNANGAQKASVLNELLSNVGPALPSILGNAGLGALAAKVAGGEAITPEAAGQVPAEVVQQVAQHVEQQDPSIVDRLGSIYAQHPALIKSLGSAVLAATLAQVANRANTGAAAAG
jgi:hypothetical protein